jgi:hypothetical protein
MRPVLLFSILVMAACAVDNPPPPGPAPVERVYRPPADGRLAERQVQAFVAAERARSQAGAAANLEGDASVESFDGRRGSNEYQWVKQKVRESEIRLDERDAMRREIEIDRKTAASLEKAAAASTDSATKDALRPQISDLNRRTADLERTLKKHAPPEEDFNDALVMRYRRQIDAAELGAAPHRP